MKKDCHVEIVEMPDGLLGDAEMELSVAVFRDLWAEEPRERTRCLNPRPKRYMTQKEVAMHTGLDPSTIYRMRMDGTIPGYLWRQLRPHGKVLFDRQAFLEWWESVAGKRPRENRVTIKWPQNRLNRLM